MRPQIARLSAAGVSPWFMLDHRKSPFEVSLAVICSSNKNLTYTVQHTFDEFTTRGDWSTLTRSTTTATLTLVNHGLSVADHLYLEAMGAPFDGNYAVAGVTDQDTVTFTVANSGLTTATRGRLFGARVVDHDLLAALTATADGNYSYPPTATRVKITSYTAGYLDFIVRQAG